MKNSSLLGALGIAVCGLAMAIAQPLDGQIIFCKMEAGKCIEKSVPEWMPINENATGVKRVPGATGQKVVGALVAVVAFWVAMGEESRLLEEEIDRWEAELEEEETAARERQIFVEAELGFLKDKALIRAAEQNYEELGDYHRLIAEANARSSSEAAAATEIDASAATPETPAVESPAALPSQSPMPEIAAAPESAVILHKDSEKQAMEILDGLVGSRRSTLLVGGTGAGKSVTESYLLNKLFGRYPDGEYWAIAQKNDSFCGLDKKGRVILFDTLDPSAALKGIDHIHGIYDKRRRLPESARIDLPPVRLILADWLSINQSLEGMKNEEPVRSSKYLTKLADIIYNGRELNVCLVVDLQSFNLLAIGMKADRNSRKNFNLVGLGNYSVDEFGSINESYGVLANMITDQNIVPEQEERTELLAQFKMLKEISLRNQRPIIFTTLEPARVALQPDLRSYKPGQVAPMKLDGLTPEILERIYKLEFELDRPKANSQEPEIFNELHKKILSYLEGKGSKKPHDMQKSRPMESASMSAIREALAELVKWGKVIDEGEDRYRLNG